MANRHLVIIPTYNEIENLPIIVGRLFEYNSNVDLLIVDDNSPDGTGKLADELATKDKRVTVLHRTEKNGLGRAYLAGFKKAFERGYEFVIEMDADGSHRPEDLPKLIAQDADLVIGSRWTKGGKTENWPFSRILISRTGNIYVRLMLGAKIKDATAGFRVYRSSLLQKIDLDSIASQGYSFQVEMTWASLRAGATVREVPIVFVERVIGSSKMTTAIVFEALWLVTKLGFTRVFKG
jgi:dolichol-phosphate mannosyltransferase